MDNRFYLMRKNEVITLVQFDSNGKTTAFSRNLTERMMDIAPLAYRSTPNEWLYKWWDDRSVPLTRDQIKQFLASRGLSTTNQYLVKNLGLSLTDYYWIKPVNSSLTWEKVNLFDNAFHDDILLSEKKKGSDEVANYSPNGSLQGNIEKTWTIIDGKRYLIKGNHSILSCESLNEVIATEIHQKQGYDNFVKYELLRIKGKNYKYGCKSEAFTSQKRELVSAWDVCKSEKKKDNISFYEHFISVCKKHGIDEDRLRSDLEYQIMTDYILTGYDRHLMNVAVLRDSETMKFIRMAPIYDSGDCLFANRTIPKSINELQKMEINSFTNTENKQLKLVRNRSRLDISRLPSADYIKKMYRKDGNISDAYIDKIVEWYKRKIDMFDKWQHKDT